MSSAEPILHDDRGRPVPPRSDRPDSWAYWPAAAWRAVWESHSGPPPYAPQG